MCIFQTFAVLYVPVKMYCTVWCVLLFFWWVMCCPHDCPGALLTQHHTWGTLGPPWSVPPAHPSAVLPIWRCSCSTFSPSRGAGVSGRARALSGLIDAVPFHLPVHPCKTLGESTHPLSVTSAGWGLRSALTFLPNWWDQSAMSRCHNLSFPGYHGVNHLFNGHW